MGSRSKGLVAVVGASLSVACGSGEVGDGPARSSSDAAAAGGDASYGGVADGARADEQVRAAEAGATPTYPDGSTTGPNLAACPGGALAKYAGGAEFYRATSGEVIACMEFDDVSIYVGQDVSDVTIRNCRFVATEDWFINVQGRNVTIEDSAFVGPAGTWIRNSYNGDHLTVRRNDFSGMANAVEYNVGYETIEDNYVHDFGNVSADQHADGLQTNGTSHAVVRHNTVLMNDVAGATGAISVFGDTGDDVLVEGNEVAGGGYTVYPGGAGYTNIRFLNNCFSTIFYPGQARAGEYAPWYPSENPPSLVRAGNRWCDGPRAGQALDENP